MNLHVILYVNLFLTTFPLKEIIDLKLPMPKSKKYASKQSSDEVCTR